MGVALPCQIVAFWPSTLEVAVAVAVDTCVA